LFHRKHDDEANGAEAGKVDEAHARYTLDVRAPHALKSLLADNLDLARFRGAPPSEGLNDEELDRLIAAAPEQARALLSTEGYFTPDVRVHREPGSDGRPRVVVEVDPGPRTVVQGVQLGVQGDLRHRADAGEPDAAALIRRLEDEWLLKPGQPFRQADWTSAKSGALGLLHTEGYPAASWADTQASVQSREQRVQLQANAESGPLFHFGDLRIQGLKRYDEQVVHNLQTFQRGTPYSEQRLRDFQDRLIRSGLFQGAVAEIDPDPQHADAAPTTVHLQEQPLQNVTIGLGYSTDTGARATLEHTHRQPFGLRWVAQDKFEVGPQRKGWDFDLRSYPGPGLWRNLVAGGVEHYTGSDEDRFDWRLRLGRVQDDQRLERQVYAEYNSAHVRLPLSEANDAQSLSAHYDWTRRDVDSLLLPTRGKALLLQGAVGYARSTAAENGPFSRAYGRVLYFKPLRHDWHARLQLEAGQVFARQQVGVPDTLLFRAGGEDSVRGYDYRSLGPKVNGVVTSGRSLLTGSAEIEHPITQRLPALWGAAFVDAGNAARRFGDLKPVVGVGVGVRYRSPVGPLRVDLAYGVDEKKVRLHLSAGVSF
jgi:translocation and assembly module TamA